MSSKRFFSIIALMFFLFVVVFGSTGCGSGSSSNFANNEPNTPTPTPNTSFTVTFDSNGGTEIPSQSVESSGTVIMPDNPTKNGYIFIGWYNDNDLKEMFLFGNEGDLVTSDITLYAGWIEDNEDLACVQYALSEIEIGYSLGDNANNVTSDLYLPTSVEELTGVTITWITSNTDTIKSDGSVTRPQASDVNVILTVSATSGNETRTKTFSVKVIHNNNRVHSEIANSSVIDIQNMNEDNSRAHISYNAEGTQVNRIQGKFSEISIENSDDALDAIQSVHSILGIADPYTELENSVINESDTGIKYRFTQFFNNKKVFGRSIIVSANDKGETNFLQSNFLASNILYNADLTPTITSDYAEQKAKEYYSGGTIAVDSEKTVLGIYTLDDYEANPVPAYVVLISGITNDNSSISETVYVNGKSGDIIKTVSNFSSLTGWGKNEFNQKVSFDVQFRPFDVLFFYLYDENLNIQLYQPNLFASNWNDYHRVGSEFNVWLNKHQVSAYYNMRKVLQWISEEFGRNSISGTGSKVKVIASASSILNPYNCDNAAWQNIDKVIYIHEKNYPDYSCASGLDVLAHESGHGITQYMVGDDDEFRHMSGAIKEGLADIFGCLIEQNWQLGEALSNNHSEMIRDIAANDAGGATEIYVEGLKIPRAAYLMHKTQNPNGLSWKKLGQVWYNAMTLGLGATTTMSDIRTFVIWTAEELNFTNDEIQSIVEAFNDPTVNISGRSVIEGVVTDQNGLPISNATVTAREQNFEFFSKLTTTDSEGKYSITELDWGTYIINIRKSNYIPFKTLQFVDESQDITVNASLFVEGTGIISGTVRDATNGSVLSGVSLQIREGWNILNGDVIDTVITNTDGTYSLEVANGFYTITMSKEEYVSTSVNVTVSGNIIQNMDLSPTIAQGQYRVVLSWATDPADLDAHVRAPSSSGGTIEIYYEHKNDYDSLGNLVNLDWDVIRDDPSRTDEQRYGPETIIFEADPEGEYEYFVHWYRGYGTWASSRATVNLYVGGSSTAVRTWTVPTSTSTEHCWRVFTVKNGIILDVNELSNHTHRGNYSEHSVSTSSTSQVTPSVSSSSFRK